VNELNDEDENVVMRNEICTMKEDIILFWITVQREANYRKVDGSIRGKCFLEMVAKWSRQVNFEKLENIWWNRSTREMT